MAVYRCYFVNSEDHVVQSCAIENADEAEAIDATRRLRAENEYPVVELWWGSSCVYRDQAE
jgi:hypothetical protein